MDTEAEGRKMVMKNKVSIVKVDESGIKAAIRKAINIYHTIQVFVSLMSLLLFIALVAGWIRSNLA